MNTQDQLKFKTFSDDRLIYNDIDKHHTGLSPALQRLSDTPDVEFEHDAEQCAQVHHIARLRILSDLLLQ
jgi:2-oxo-4-hydroxy-4-carboxy--5-ureidoimidazoline (OHCU) decarboxylase